MALVVLVMKLTCTMRDRGLFPLSKDAFVLPQVKLGSSTGSSSTDSPSAGSSSAGSFSTGSSLAGSSSTGTIGGQLCTILCSCHVYNNYFLS
ncbi:hypothetical protein EB796_004231 [Bugula neritina]|uniref:Uncharacterized protein n=1 Tax=Bugula neritina TaxID=10212 RepID=A0A7J7KHS6_BUGNE|nr:hypothetical protein EB796_004231 [Bugula neritina]